MLLEIDPVSQQKIEQALEVLRNSEASSKLAFSSYTHAAFDQETRIITGDARWRIFAQEAQSLNCQLSPLVWEMQLPGALNEVTFLVPKDGWIEKTRVKSGLGTMCWWSVLTPEITDKLRGSFLLRDKWVSVKDFVQKQTHGQCSGKVTEQVLDKIDFLKSWYEDILSNSLGLRLSGISEKLYEGLARTVFGELAGQFLVKRESYFGSEFGQQISQRAAMYLRDKWLSKVVKNMLLSDKGLFIGGKWGQPFMVSFNWASDSFTLNNINAKTGQVDQFGRAIEEAEILDLLEQDVIRPTGKLFDTLLVMGDGELIIHDGNDYGVPKSALFCLSEARSRRINLPIGNIYHQLFPDNQDSFAPIVFTGRRFTLQETVPSLVSLFLWDLKPGLWQEKIVQAIKTGKPQVVDLYKEVLV